MGFTRNSSIQGKLTFVIFFAAVLGLSITCLTLEVYERTSSRASLSNELSAHAEMLGMNTAASLAFNDQKSAQDTLSALRVDRQIVAASIYDIHGRIFAEYRRARGEKEFAMPVWQEGGERLEPNTLTLYRTIVLGGEKVGGIAIVSDFSELRSKMTRFRETSAVVLILSILVTALVSHRFVRFITEPILQLAGIAGKVSAQEDYSFRGLPEGNDEVGTLVRSFNQMLERIRERDSALNSAKEDLEIRVNARTKELQAEVNERIRADSKLQASLKELKDLEAALDQHCIVARTDPSGIITYANEKFCSVSKYSREELVGKEHRIVKSGFHPTEFMKTLWETIQSGQVWKGEVKNRAKDGSAYWLNTTIVPFCDGRGKPRQYIAIRTDITAMKRVEEDLRRAKEAAEAASKAKSEFLANMSHEIRTPLNGVIGMTDLALETNLQPEQREYLETVKMSADSLLTVINGILDFSKIEAGKIDLESIDFNLRNCLETALRTVALQADEKGLELLCELAPDVPEVVRGDSSRLRQIVLNLAGNAIKFTQEGEVRLRVKLQAQDGNNCILDFAVLDTGIGIPEEKRQSIFDPFTQADSSTTRKYGGTGLGLTISARLVEMMGGKIWAESEVGRGSEFHFTARLGIANDGAVESAAIARPEMLRGVKVLVVDDNLTNRRILEEMMRRWEMRPDSVGSGEEALAQVSTAREAGEPYELILTDMNMQGMDGFQLVEKIRQRPELSTATIMMLTSSGHRGDAARCQELGVSAYLLKPIRQSELQEAIARVLGAGQQNGAVPLITRYSLGEAREPSASLRVLLAEDNPVNQRLAMRLLEKRGHFVAVAGNGRDALAAVEREHFDLILMDVQMPEMDGFEATAAIREKEQVSGNHLPIIALTAHAMKGDREKCLAGGMDGYLAKPIRPQELDELLRTYQARRTEASNAAEKVPSNK